jgi:hypothetical protein
MSWSRPFDDPVPTPKGKPHVTLKNAAAYIMKLPKREADAEHWQIAMEQLIDAAEGRNFIMHARIGMMRALNHGTPDPVVVPGSKRAKAYRIV